MTRSNDTSGTSPNSKNGSWPRRANNVEPLAPPIASRSITSGRSKTWRNTAVERNRSGFRSWLPASARRWFSAIAAIWTFNMDAHPETRYHVHGQAKPDAAGKRSAVKVARYVWRGAFGKGQQCTSPDAYPTRKMGRLYAKSLAMIASLESSPTDN